MASRAVSVRMAAGRRIEPIGQATRPCRREAIRWSLSAVKTRCLGQVFNTRNPIPINGMVCNCNCNCNCNGNGNGNRNRN